MKRANDSGGSERESRLDILNLNNIFMNDRTPHKSGELNAVRERERMITLFLFQFFLYFC